MSMPPKAAKSKAEKQAAEVAVPTRAAQAAPGASPSRPRSSGASASAPGTHGADLRRQRERAIALVKKHGGRHAHTAVQTDWVLSLVTNIDKAYWRLGDATATTGVAARKGRQSVDGGTNDQINAAISEIKTLRAELEDLRTERVAHEEEKRIAESHVMELRHRLATAESLSNHAVSEMESLRERLSKDRLRDLKLRGKNGARVAELKDRLSSARTTMRNHRSLIRHRDLELEALSLEQQHHLSKRAALERQMERLSSTRERDKIIYDSELTNLKIQLANATVSRMPNLRTALRGRNSR